MSPSNQVGSILHYTSNYGDCCSPGQRMPAVFVIPNANKLHVRIGSSTDGNWGVDTTAGLALGQYSSVVINTFGSRVQVSIDGKIEEANMTTARISGIAHLFMADPFYRPANAFIKNYALFPSVGLLNDLSSNFTSFQSASISQISTTLTSFQTAATSNNVVPIPLNIDTASSSKSTTDNTGLIAGVSGGGAAVAGMAALIFFRQRKQIARTAELHADL